MNAKRHSRGKDFYLIIARQHKIERCRYRYLINKVLKVEVIKEIIGKIFTWFEAVLRIRGVDPGS